LKFVGGRGEGCGQKAEGEQQRRQFLFHTHL
jgi:hypothetical protein